MWFAHSTSDKQYWAISFQNTIISQVSRRNLPGFVAAVKVGGKGTLNPVPTAKAAKLQ